MPGKVSIVEMSKHRNAIISRILAGDTLKSIGADFGFSQQALSRFKHRCVKPATLGIKTAFSKEVVQAVRDIRDPMREAAATLVVGTSTADLVAKKLARYDRILELAEKDKDVSGWASVDRAETAALQLQAQLRGEVNQVHSQTTVQMLVYTPQVLDEGQDQAGEVLEARAVEEIEAPVAAEPPPPPPVRKPPKPPKPPSRMQLLQKLSARERKEAIRLIGQGIDPFAPPPPPPPAR